MTAQFAALVVIGFIVLLLFIDAAWYLLAGPESKRYEVPDEWTPMGVCGSRLCSQHHRHQGWSSRSDRK